jgi:hypothetical protein
MKFLILTIYLCIFKVVQASHGTCYCIDGHNFYYSTIEECQILCDTCHKGMNYFDPYVQE